MAQQVIDEAVDRRQPTIAGRRAVAASRLGVIEEREHCVGVEIIEPERRNRLRQVTSEEHEEQPKRVAVRAHGVLARPTDPAEVVAEEALHVAKQVVRSAPHRRRAPTKRRWKRRPASASNSGVAVK